MTATSLMDAIGEGVVVFDPALTVLEVNRAAERILGRPRRHLVGRHRRAARIRLFREDGRPWREADERLEAVAAGGESVVDLACRVLRPDRSFADVLASVRPFGWSSTERSDVVLTLNDVTARRRAELAVREAEERWRALVDGALGALIVVDADGAIIEFNAAAEELFGVPPAAVVARAFDELFDEEDRGAARLLRARLIANPARRGGPVRETLVARGHDGRRFRVEISITTAAQAGRRVLCVSVRERCAPAVAGAADLLMAGATL